MSARSTALRSVLRDPTIRRLEAAFAGFSMGEHATWIATLVYAFDRGGMRETGVVAFVLLSAAMFTAPFASYAGDRFPRDRVLAVGYATQTVAMSVTAIVMHAQLPAVAVYLAAGASAAAVTVARPALGALLPFVADTPADLTAANVAMGLIENLGIFAGPLVAAGLLAVGSPALVFAAMASIMAVSTVLVLHVGGDRERLKPPNAAGSGAWREVLGGFDAIRQDGEVRSLIGCLSLGALLAGAIEVLFVAVARVYTTGGAEAGLLNSTFGLGAIVGAATSVLLVGKARMTPYIAVGMVVLAGPLVGLAGATNRLMALAMFTLSGAGLSLLKIAGTNLLQRATRASVAGRVFGVLEAVQMGAMAVGSFAISAVAESVGLRTSLALAGLGIPAIGAMLAPRLFVMDRSAAPADPQVVRRLRADPIFAPLSAPSLERLALSVQRRDPEAGRTIATEGEPGDTYYLILSGEVAISVGGEQMRALGPGESFGEIALLLDVPRTATATTAQPTELLTVHRDSFLEALHEHHRARSSAESIAARWAKRT